MKKDNNITRWTIEDVRNPNSEFWRYTEDELYDYADGLKPDEVEDFFSATTELFEQAERNRIESQEETIDDFGKRVYSYVIDINDMDSDNMTGLDYD